MSPKIMNTAHERYDQSLQYAHYKHLPPDYPRPHFTRDWPPENVALLEKYATWLSSGGASTEVIRTIYIPIAGHVLGLNLKPHTQLNLDEDLQKALDFVLAKKPGPDWADVSRVSLNRFRRFMMNERGQILSKKHAPNVPGITSGLPEWLVQELQRYQHIKQRNWRESRLEENERRFWDRFVCIWRFLCEKRGVKELGDIKRQYLYDYADFRLSQGKAVKGVNSDLRSFHGFMAFLQDNEYPVSQSLLNFPCLKEPDTLPRFMTDEQVKKLRDDFELQVRLAKDSKTRRNALLDRAAFYLLWQGGMRRGEVEELRLEDLDLAAKKLMVRNGKGLKDRVVYLTLSATQALQEYLVVRGMGLTDHVFLYRNQPLCKDLIHGRLQACGTRVGVKVFAHRLRHTCATQLLNAGCRITSIQKFLGHKKLNSTMIYARVHDQTVADDYYMAMSSVEKRLELLNMPDIPPEKISLGEREELIIFANKLAEPELSRDLRLKIVSQMQLVLINGVLPAQILSFSNTHSPPVLREV